MITDSKETTYLIGEKYMSPENYMTGIDSTPTPIRAICFSAMSGDDVSLIRWGNTTLLPSMDRTSNSTVLPQLHRRSSAARTAPDGMPPFAMGTCSCSAGAIDGPTHQAMATRNGHEVIDPSLIHN